MSQNNKLVLYFFFNDTATTEIYTLSLHDALPISASGCGWGAASSSSAAAEGTRKRRSGSARGRPLRPGRAANPGASVFEKRIGFWLLTVDIETSLNGVLTPLFRGPEDAETRPWDR